MRDDAAAKPPLLVFSDDWGRHPSSSQHLIGRLLARRQVVWVNTIGTRPPRLDLQTARRVLEKLRHWSRSAPVAATDAATAPRVLNPRMWPSFGSRFSRRLNRWLLLRALRPVIDALPHPPVVVTTLPLMADLVGELPAKRWVYYCVDDFGVWPGYDGATMQRMERELLAKIDVAVAVSETLVEHLRQLGRSAHLLSHGVDLEHWRRPVPDDCPSELAGLDAPYVVFWGVIDRRMDVDFVRRLSRNPGTGTVVLFGPQEDPDPALWSMPGVAVRPALPFARLPAIAGAAAVLVMPYMDLPATRAIQPLKLKEYLATGKPVVVRDLPATRPWADACDVCETADAFAQAVARRVGEGLPESQRLARERLAAESWEGKARLFESWLDGTTK